MQRRDRPRLAEAEAPQRRGVGLGALVVDLVGDEHHGLAGPAQQLHAVLVVVGRPDGGVDDEEHDVGEVDGDLGLLGDPQVDAGGVVAQPPVSTRVNAAADPLGVVGDPVAGDAGHVLDDGLAAADDPVDQGRLADVRAADDGDDRQRAAGGLGVERVVAALEQRAVLVTEVEVLQPGPQRALDGGGVLGLRHGVLGAHPTILPHGEGALDHALTPLQGPPRGGAARATAW